MKKIIILFVSILLFNCSPESEPTMYTLTVTSNPTEGGTISPSGGEYEDGTVLTIRVTPNTNYEFDRWSGSVSGRETSLSITMDSNKSIVGNFVLSDTDGDGVTDDVDTCPDTPIGDIVDLIGCKVVDFDPPVIESFTFSPTEIDISNEPQTVIISLHVTDNVGVNLDTGIGYIYVQNPDNVVGTQQGGSPELTSGNNRDGIYTLEVTIPSGLQPGEWRIFGNGWTDLLSNRNSGTFPTQDKSTLTVLNESENDFDPPVIESFTFSPTEIDISNEPQTVIISLHVTDNVGVNLDTGIGYIYVQNPDNVVGTQQGGSPELTSGNNRDGIYTLEVTIPSGLQPGEWRIFGNGWTDLLSNRNSGTFPTQDKSTLTVLND
jgi:hypothetical protein